MKNTKLLLLSVAVGLLQGTSFAQSSSANNAFLFGNFLGWNNTNGANILPFRTNNVQRLQINGTSNLAAPFNTNGNNTGYVGFGLNNNSPLFHLDVLTPAINWGELHIGVGPSDVPNSKSGFLNATLNNAGYVPTMFGNLDASQPYPAITSLGNIDGAQDIAANNNPVERFIVGTGLQYYQTGVSNLNEINNRVAFTWQNANTIKMMMNAKGEII